MTEALDLLRGLCLALPEAHEVEAWGEPTFRVRNRIFATYGSADDPHGQAGPASWVKAAAGEQELRVRAAPDRFFVPPYVGVRGWIGIRLDRIDRVELDEMLRDSYRLVAPRRLAALLDERADGC
jgi:hypothetical protein